jgi:ApeA N-terminal domain 1
MKFDEVSLDDVFDASGYWWLPDFQEDRLPGTLSYTPTDGIVLILQGVFDQPSLRDPSLIFGGKAFSAERIYGEQADGERLTVCGAFMTRLNTISSFDCRYVLAGACLSSEDNDQPATTLFSFNNLEEWSGVPFLQPDRSELPDRTTYSFPNNLVALLSIPKAEHLPELTLMGYTTTTLTPNDATFSRRAHFRTWLEKSELTSMLEFVNDVGQLLTILMGTRANLNQLRFSLDSDTYIHVFFQRVRAKPPKAVSAIQMPLTLRELGDKAASVFAEWFRSIVTMRPVYSAFFSTLFNDSSFIDTKFQALTQALESFHRRTRDGSYLKVEEYSEVAATLSKALPQGIPESLRARLKNTIKYGNEFSLRKRLENLIAEIQPKTREILRIDSSSFVSDVVDTRNYYTHLDEATKTPSVGNSSALYYLNQRLSALFLIHVLITLGIQEETATEGVIKGRRFSA